MALTDLLVKVPRQYVKLEWNKSCMVKLHHLDPLLAVTSTERLPLCGNPMQIRVFREPQVSTLCSPTKHLPVEDLGRVRLKVCSNSNE